MPCKLSFLRHFVYRIFPLGIIMLLFSCGLKYNPTESPQTFEEKRQNEIEIYVQTQLNIDNKTYSSVAFGETQVVKPISYRTLDSLYAIKYENEQNGRFDTDLEKNIETQRLITLNDTNQVLYIEDHIFSLGVGDTLEYFSALFQMEKDLKIDDVIIKESVFIPKKYKDYYLAYLFEESILSPGYMPNSEEANFYSFFKQPLADFSKTEKDDFIVHTLKLMELANRKNSISTSTLLKASASNYFHGTSYANYNESYSDILVEQQTSALGEEIIKKYTFTYSYKMKDDNGEMQNYSYKMEYDPFLRLSNITKI